MCPSAEEREHAQTCGTRVDRACASIVLWPTVTPAAADSCTLTRQQKVAAVKAFKKLAPIYHDPRCVNCHGAVNPFAPTGGHGGGYIDIREEARSFLNPAAAPGDLVAIDPAGQTRELQDIREIAESPVAITDNDVIRRKAQAPMQKACRECHVDDWIIPMSHNHFVGRSWKSLCVHMKTSSLTNSPDQFLRHMQDDRQVILGFKGERGLNTPTRGEPPAMPFDTMARHANDWIEAMGARFHQPPECGCEVDGIALEIRHHIYTDPQSSSAHVGAAQFDGTVVFDVLLQKQEGTGNQIYRDGLRVLRPLVVRHVEPSFWKCTESGQREEAWILTAVVDEEEKSMQLRFSFTKERAGAKWTCTARGMSVTDRLDVDLFGMLETVNMPVTSGSVAQASERGVSEIESITVTVIDSPFRPEAQS